MITRAPCRPPSGSPPPRPRAGSSRRALRPSRRAAPRSTRSRRSPALSRFAAIMPATNVPCPSVSTHGSPPTKLRVSTMRPAKSGKRAVDAGVDDRDLHRCERCRRLRPRVEGVVVLEVPLLRRRAGRSGRRRAAGAAAASAATATTSSAQAAHRATTCGVPDPGRIAGARCDRDAIRPAGDELHGNREAAVSLDCAGADDRPGRQIGVLLLNLARAPSERGVARFRSRASS